MLILLIVLYLSFFKYVFVIVLQDDCDIYTVLIDTGHGRVIIVFGIWIILIKKNTDKYAIFIPNIVR